MNCLKIIRTLWLSWTISMWPKSTHSAHARPALLKATQDARSSPGSRVCLLGCSADPLPHCQLDVLGLWPALPTAVKDLRPQLWVSVRDARLPSTGSLLESEAQMWDVHCGQPDRVPHRPRAHPTGQVHQVHTDLVPTFCPFSPVPPVKCWFPCIPNAEIVSVGIGQFT